MKEVAEIQLPAPSAGQPDSELLILPDGRVLAHQLTPALATVLRELNPEDDTMKHRASLGTRHKAHLAS